MQRPREIKFGTLPHRNKIRQMPSVGMRRSTRVFGARVLRSGRRMWTEPCKDGKYLRAVGGGHAFVRLLRSSADGGGNGSDSVNDVWQENEHRAAVEINAEPQIEENSMEGVVEVRNMYKTCGIVYRRKRKRVELTSAGFSQDKRFGKKFVRRQSRGKYRIPEPETCGNSSPYRSPLLAVVASKSSYDSGYWISCFLSSVLSYMTRARICIRQLSAFVLVKPVLAAYSSGGVLFYQDSISVNNPGVCVIWGSSSLIPVFAVDFSAIPFCFVHMHTSMHYRSLHWAQLLESHSVDSDMKDEEMTDVDFAQEHCSQVPPGRYLSYHVSVASQSDDSGRKELSCRAVGLPKSPIRMMQLRSSRNIRKTSSLRRKRGRPSSAVQAQKACEALASDFFRIRHNGVQFPAAVPSHAHRKLDKRSSIENIKELKTALGLLTEDMRYSSCAANLLIIEPDKCYREGGVIITLELSASEKWYLAVVKDGMKRYSLTAQKVMMPSYSNRFTNATVWAAGGGWKLEFLNKQDWLIFKELYKECSDRNVQTPVASVIPVPGVQKVPIVDSNYAPYVRPNSYIKMQNDELTRAMVKKGANYDMESDDEKWLDKFNDQLYADRELEQLVTPETFELVIDALEKGCHCNPEYYLEEQGAHDFCMHLERKEVVNAIWNYWIKKRKQKRAALVRIFQLYQPGRIEVIPKSVSRKKRSFKRQASQGGRGKQRTFLQAMVAKRDALQQNKLHKVQEAKATANRSEGLSVLKRQRAQILMENADLAIYKAIMALRIAEAAKVTEAPGTVASFFLS